MIVFLANVFPQLSIKCSLFSIVLVFNYLSLIFIINCHNFYFSVMFVHMRPPPNARPTTARNVTVTANVTTSTNVNVMLTGAMKRARST